MLKRVMVISSMLGFAFLAACATSGDLEKVQAQQNAIGAKADQALQDAQAAKASADAAKARADEAAARADTAAKAAEERERIAAEKEKVADEKAAQAEAVFQKSMRK